MAVLALTMAAAASGSYKNDEVSMVTSTREQARREERTTYGSTEIAEIGEDLRKLKTLHEG